ncbi:unnamed protein product [Schistosoma rodhaini]|uniref:Peptidase M14 domain-containing protein n=1 Tax=Schistosoma rodhaini TaxID=6188 RepID=A0AA85FSI0_9TREM|nr:unnamed protein product [Schistosoma rodhaini]
MDCRIGSILFSSNFDSGNLARVEKVIRDSDEPPSLSLQSNSKQQQPVQKATNKVNNTIFGNLAIAEVRADYEFRMWIRPDCAGTAYANGNRTWFYFSMRGYSPGKIMRATIMNMNKQSKIYSQGFSPIYRVCGPTVAQSRWQRIRDKPIWELVNGQFLLTFIHRFQDPRGSITYFAFCYPWTYNEMQTQLNKLDSIFHYNKNKNINVNNESLCNKYNTMKLNPINNNDKFEDPFINSSDLLRSFNMNKTKMINGTVNTIPTSSALSSSLSCSSSSSLSSSSCDPKCFPENDLFDKIYFHRELLCYSLEGRRIELLTITDWSRCTFVEEDRFDPLLFPDLDKSRPWKFTNKKVVLVSARVHPGETPSSHVFNGLLEFLLRINDHRACELRKHYVFKLIPMLNPDGVFRGHYRTDTRGVNLNRVYLKPDYLYYPSIYATKALITYYHTNYGTLKSYASFLDDIFKQKLFTTTNYFETNGENITIEYTDNEPRKLSPNQTICSCEDTKETKEKVLSDCETQEQSTSKNYSIKEHYTNIKQDEEKKESHFNSTNDQLSTTYEQQMDNQNIFLTKSFDTGLSSSTTSNSLSKTNSLAEKHLSSKHLSPIEHMFNSSGSTKNDEDTSIVHRINFPIADTDKNSVTNECDAELRSTSNYFHATTETNNLPLKTLSRLNNSTSISTPFHKTELNKKVYKNVRHLKPTRFPITCNTELGSQKPLEDCHAASRTQTAISTTSNLLPLVTKLTTSTLNPNVAKPSSLDDGISKKFSNQHRYRTVEQKTPSQPSYISYFDKNKRRSTLKVDCLPYFLTKWNVPYQKAITTKHSPKLTSENLKIVNTQINFNNEEAIYFNDERNAKQKDFKSIDNVYSSKKFKSYLKYGKVKKRKINFFNQKFSILNTTQIPYNDDTMTTLIPLQNTTEHDYSCSSINQSTVIEKDNIIMKSTNHIVNNNSHTMEDISNEEVNQIMNEEFYSFDTSHSVVGNEGSDLDADHYNDLERNFIDEDLSINPYYVHILESLGTLVRQEKNTTNDSNEAVSSVNITDDNFNMNELNRIQLLKEQLQQLRKADHLSDVDYLRFDKNEDSNVAFYFDLHGHCSKRGCFLYGNWLEEENKMVDNVLYALLVGVNSIYFDFDSCNFSLRNMYQKDRKGTSTKEGAGRVALWKHLGLTHCYTVECNYNSGPLPSRLSRFIASAHPNDSKCFTPIGAFYGPHWSDMVNTASSQSFNFSFNACSSTSHTSQSGNQALNGIPRYTPAHYEDVGRALMIAILDFNQINPWPKVAGLGGSTAESNVGILTLWSSLPEFMNINTLREWARKYIRGIAPNNVMNKPLITRNTEYLITKVDDISKSQIIQRSLTRNESSKELLNTSSVCSEFNQTSIDQNATSLLTVQSDYKHCSHQLNPITPNFKWNKHQNEQLHYKSVNLSSLNSAPYSCKSSISNNNRTIINESHQEDQISSNLHYDYLRLNCDTINKTLDHNIENDENLLKGNTRNDINDQLICHNIESDKLLKTTLEGETIDQSYIMNPKKIYFSLHNNNNNKLSNKKFNHQLYKPTKSNSLNNNIKYKLLNIKNKSIFTTTTTTTTTNKYFKKYSNEKTKHVNSKKFSRNEPRYGFYHSPSGYTKHFSHSANINSSTVINTKNKPFSAKCQLLQKSKNDKVFNGIINNFVYHQRSRSCRLKSIKTPHCENKLLTKDNTWQSQPSNITCINNCNSSEANCHDSLSESDLNAITKNKENTLIPLMNRSNSSTDLQMTLKSEDCIKEIKEMFKSVTLD